MDINTLLCNGIEVSFPLWGVFITVLLHTAPRVLQASGMNSLPLEVHHSIIAGCKHSVALTKAYLKQRYLSVEGSNPRANIKSL